MNIAVISVGGVGGYFGGKLTRLLQTEGDLKIYFVARNAHLSEIKKNGLLLDADEGEMLCKPTSVTDDISDLPQLDFCLVCVKCYDLENVLIQLKSKVSDRTMILPLLNGVDIYKRTRAIIRNGVVFPSCVYVGAYIEKPGYVKQRGGTRTIHFGKDPKNEYVDQRLFGLMKRADIIYVWEENPYIEIWSKFIFIAPFSLVTANFGKTIGEILQSEELIQTVKKIMEEIYLIACKKQIPLPRTIVNDSCLKASNFPFDTKTSFQRDYELGDRPDERDLFGGAILRMGQHYGIKTAATKMIYDSIQENKIIK